MSERNEEYAELFAELGITEEIADLGPDACTCGVEGCSDHETWGARLVIRIFEGSKTDSVSSDSQA